MRLSREIPNKLSEEEDKIKQHSQSKSSPFHWWWFEDVLAGKGISMREILCQLNTFKANYYWQQFQVFFFIISKTMRRRQVEKGDKRQKWQKMKEKFYSNWSMLQVGYPHWVKWNGRFRHSLNRDRLVTIADEHYNVTTEANNETNFKITMRIGTAANHFLTK